MGQMHQFAFIVQYLQSQISTNSYLSRLSILHKRGDISVAPTLLQLFSCTCMPTVFLKHYLDLAE